MAAHGPKIKVTKGAWSYAAVIKNILTLNLSHGRCTVTEHLPVLLLPPLVACAAALMHVQSLSWDLDNGVRGTFSLC